MTAENSWICKLQKNSKKRGNKRRDKRKHLTYPINFIHFAIVLDQILITNTLITYYYINILIY